MRKFLVCCILTSFIIAFSAQAQDNNSKLIEKLVNKNVLTQQEADQLLEESSAEKEENVIVKAQNFVRKGFNTPYLNFGGYGLLMYQYHDVEKNHHDLRPRVTFLWMDGKITDHLRYYVLYEFVSSTLFEYYAEWLPSSAFNVRVGQYKVPFTLENPISLTQLEAIMNTRSVSSLAGMGTDVGVNNGAGRDIGIQISGSLLPGTNHDYIQYWAGVFQGTGINRREDNNVKDFATTLALQPVKGFRLAGSMYAGQATYSIADGTVQDHVRNRWALSADYKSDRFYGRTEWINANDGGIKKEGLYGTALWYFVPDKFNAFLRADHFYNNKDTKEKAMDYTGGINYYFAPSCRLQLNYTYSDVSDNWTSTQTSHNVYAQMQIVF